MYAYELLLFYVALAYNYYTTIRTGMTVHVNKLAVVIQVRT